MWRKVFVLWLLACQLAWGATPTTLDVSWSHPGADGFRLYWNQPCPSANYMPIIGELRAVTVTGLTPNTTYSAQITAVNQFGESACSPLVSGTTLAQGVPPSGAPANVDLRFSPSSMGVTLNAVGTNGSPDADVLRGDDVTTISGNLITIGAGSNRFLVVVVNWQYSGSAPTSRSVTWNGTTMTESIFHTNDINSVGIYTLANPATGNNTLAASWTNTADAYIGAICFNDSGGINTAHNATGNGLTLDITGDANGATVATHIRNGSTGTPNHTLFWDHEDFAPGGMGNYQIGGSGTITHDFNNGSNLGTNRATAGVHVIAASGQTVSVNQVTETDTAQAITRKKIKGIGQITETDSAQAITRVKTLGVGQVSETDAAQTLTALKQKGIGQTSELDTAQAIAWAPKNRLVNQVSETDSAQTINRLKTRAIAQVEETDTAQALNRIKTKAINQVEETDLAQPVSRSGITVLLGQVTETDLAQAIAYQVRRLVNMVVETDLAQAISVIGGGSGIVAVLRQFARKFHRSSS